MSYPPQPDDGPSRPSSPAPDTGSWLTRLRRSIPTPSYGSTLRVLTATSKCSALVFSAFLGVHLVSPLAAAVSGTSFADKTLLIGRAYYLPSETLTIYLPLALHLTSSTLKRLLITFKTRRRPALTPHFVTGWLMPFFLIPHILTHRLWPADPTPPISGLSPGELGFEYVGWGLNVSPIWGYGSYIVLVGLGVWHSGVGMMKVVSWLKGPRPPKSKPEDIPLDGLKGGKVISDEDAEKMEEGRASGPMRRERPVVTEKRKIGLRSIMLGFLGIIAIGLVRVARDSRGTSRVMASRYAAAYGRWLSPIGTR